ELPIDEITGLESRRLRGCSRLEAHTRTGAVVVAWFTRARQAAFDEAIEAAQPLLVRAQHDGRADGDVPTDGAELDRPGRSSGQQHGGASRTTPTACDECGKPLSQAVGVCTDCLDKRRLVGRLLRRARPYLLPMSGGLLLMLIITAIEMTQPLLTKVLIDRVIPDRDLQLFVWVITALVAIHSF